MPKDKDEKRKSMKRETSDSDSGPEDRGPSQVKKPKLDRDDVESFHIDGMKYLKVRTFKGKVLIDIREYYEVNGDLKPGKKGISLSAAQWKKVVSMADEVDDALKKT